MPYGFSKCDRIRPASKPLAILTSFCSSCDGIWAQEFPDDESARRIYCSLKQAHKRRKQDFAGIYVAKRGRLVYIIREGRG